MTEDNIIRQDRPHEVNIPEGSHMAVAKTATPQEASVRKVYEHAGGEEVEHIAPDKFVSDASDTMQGVPDRFVGDNSGIKKRGADDMPPPAQAKGPAELDMPPERRVAAPDAITAPPALARGSASVLGAGATTEAPAPPAAQALASASESSHEAAHLASSPPPELPEMDFPARVVHLHIENENLRKRLDELDADR